MNTMQLETPIGSIPVFLTSSVPMNDKKSPRLPAVWVLLSLLVTGCGANEPAAPAASAPAVDVEKKILRIAYTREIDVLNAFTSQNLVDIEFSMVEGLITTNENNTYIPVLAKEIPTEENGLVVHKDDGAVEMTWRLHEKTKAQNRYNALFTSYGGIFCILHLLIPLQAVSFFFGA